MAAETGKDVRPRHSFRSGGSTGAAGSLDIGCGTATEARKSSNIGEKQLQWSWQKTVAEQCHRQTAAMVVPSSTTGREATAAFKHPGF